jgi:hypothetical protein
MYTINHFTNIVKSQYMRPPPKFVLLLVAHLAKRGWQYFVLWSTQIFNIQRILGLTTSNTENTNNKEEILNFVIINNILITVVESCQ